VRARFRVPAAQPLVVAPAAPASHAAWPPGTLSAYSTVRSLLPSRLLTQVPGGRFPGGPAEKSGMPVGAKILKVNGQAVATKKALMSGRQRLS
jgi:S1-C subfamily serine protease